MNELPVVVVGAGPVGLAAAAELLERGLEPLVLERGDQAGAAVAQWHHVRVFSPWSGLVAPAARRLLEAQARPDGENLANAGMAAHQNARDRLRRGDPSAGSDGHRDVVLVDRRRARDLSTARGWRHPDPDGYPTGAEWAESYLVPLAEALGERVRFGAEVVGVARRGRDRVVDDGRDSEPLTVHLRSGQRITAHAVIDASGTWSSPNPLGGDGLPALGEEAALNRIVYQVPDLTDPTIAERYAGKHVVVAGSGHSALTALVALTALEPSTRITWLLRRGAVGAVFGGGAADQLPARGALGQRAKAAVATGQVSVVTGFRTAAVERSAGNRLDVVSAMGDRVERVDEVVVVTGFRPDLSWLSEIRLALDSTLQAPVALAPLIDPNVHSCGTVPPHGVRELAHPERNVFLAGMKSYGRAPTFLARTGYEQVRSIAAALAGDRQSAERVELVLPETGVCGGSGLVDATPATRNGCCVS